MDWYIGNEWTENSKGLHKKVLSLCFSSVDKPQLNSHVHIKVRQVENLETRPSKYLSSEPEGSKQELEMGTAVTPVDCYVELLVQQMIVGETAACSITTEAGESIRFIITLERIVSGQEIQKLTVAEMYALALRYKENGVSMFKLYPKFAHDYFSRAAQFLISYKPFQNMTLKADGVDASDLEALFVQIQTNLAACLLNEKRYNDVIHMTQFVETIPEPSEKSVYRRSLAYFHLKEYDKAQKTIEKVPNYEEKRDFTKLRDRIAVSLKNSDAHYKGLVQRMFS